MANGSANIVAKNDKYLVALENVPCLAYFHKQICCIYSNMIRKIKDATSV